MYLADPEVRQVDNALRTDLAQLRVSSAEELAELHRRLIDATPAGRPLQPGPGQHE
jgi:hypothetical protein